MNLNNPVLKGAIILLLTSILTLTTNLPESGTQWMVFAFATFGTLALYFAQSKIFPSTSQTGQLDIKDIAKGLLVSLGNALSTWAATAAEGTAINWKSLIITMIGLFAGYLLKQYQTESPKN